MELRRRP